jgi:hypothetical protein
MTTTGIRLIEDEFGEEQVHFTNLFWKRFWKKTRILENCCIIWIGACNWQGYGQICYRIKGKKIQHGAHRIAYEHYHNIKLKPKQLVLHKCDNPSCLKEEHLFLGDYVDNMQDCINKGRYRSGTTRLYDEEVEEIKRLYKTGKFTQKFIGKMFKVDQTYISKVINSQKRQTAIYSYIK